MRRLACLVLLLLTACASPTAVPSATPTATSTATATPAPSTAQVIIPPTPTRPTSTPTITPSPTLTPTATATPYPLGACNNFTSQLATSLRQGNRLAFVNTASTAPNNVRSAPARDAALVWKAAPGDLLGLLSETPVCIDGLTWWQVETSNGKLQGWTAEGQGSEQWLVPPLAATAEALTAKLTLGASVVYQNAVAKIEPRCLTRATCPTFWPDRAQLTLRGYVTKPPVAPKIQVMALAQIRELVSPTFNQQLIDLQAALVARPSDPPLVAFTETLDLLNAQPHYVSFANGVGVAHLAFWTETAIPINNSGLYYSFTGFTNDGRYLVTALLPITAPGLPANAAQYPTTIPTLTPNGSNNADFIAAVFSFNAEAALRLAALPPDQFTPKLNDLDTLLSTLKVEP